MDGEQDEVPVDEVPVDEVPVDEVPDDEVLVVGEALVDVVRTPQGPERELPGGSAANAAVALARLGVPVRLLTALGPDARGDLLVAHLEAEGVGWAADPRVLARTGTARATLREDGSAAYDFDISWRLSDRPSGLGEPSPAALVVSSLAPVLAPGAAQVLALVAALGRRAAVVYDVNARPAVTGGGPGLVAAARSTAALSDLVKASDEDLDVLAPGEDPVAAAQRLLGEGAGAVVVTRGSEGATWVDHERVVDVPGRPARVVDTIGAGDTFGAALTRWLLAGGALSGRRPGAPGDRWDLTDAAVREALEWAAAAAAVTVGRAGADPPRLADLARL
ncbi:PfkB family carbohydrate kinase [Nocardioides solisilvae]|uniref:PfkB family carbohydrate kinase n=1 Tax=Nocardioides solisilvae TaxID=1542435 RepID=UPI000D7415E0|nr:PfkB family carbohydrate kinase [Nocardioides solisilvae]